MDNNLNDCVTDGETPKKKTKKYIIIGIISVAVILSVILFLIIKAPAAGKIKIGGKICTYSADEGIKGAEKVCEGIVDVNKGECLYYPTDGEPVEADPVEVFSGKYPVVYLLASPYHDDKLAFTRYNIFGEFKTHTGTTHESTPEELKKNKSLIFLNNGDTACGISIITEKGVLDWDEIEEEYDEIIASNSFTDVEYLELLKYNFPEQAMTYVLNDDVQGAVEKLGKLYGDGKAAMMLFLAGAKSDKMILDGDINYYVTEKVGYVENIEKCVLNIDIHTTKENAQKIKENYGFTSEMVY